MALMDTLVTSRPSYEARRLLTFNDVAEALAISPRSVRRLAEAGAFPIVRVGRLVRVAPEDLQAFVARSRGEARIS